MESLTEEPYEPSALGLRTEPFWWAWSFERSLLKLRSWRIDEGRLLFGDSGDGGLCIAWEVEGLAGFASSWFGGWTAPFSPLAFPVGVAGCDLGGPPLGVDGRDVAGGDSGGAGMFVPSVSEKLTGLIDRGWNLLGMTAATSCNFREGSKWRESW